MGPLEEIDGKQFFKLSKTYTISKLLCAWSDEFSKVHVVKALMSKTDVIEQICEARDNLFAHEMEKVGVKIRPQTRLRSKAHKTMKLQIPQIGRVVARGHGEIPDMEMLLVNKRPVRNQEGWAVLGDDR